jgi:SAM-dependent methyltransferase
LGNDKSKARATSLVTRSRCRICGCPELTPVLDLGEQCIAGAFADPDGEKPVQRRIPLQLVRCDTTRSQDACGLLQLKHTVPGAILYRSYWYRSGINRTMTENLHGIARQAEELVGVRPGDLVIDVGCNDGTLLDGYAERGARFLGFDPSDIARYAEEKGYEVIRDFFDYARLRRRHPDQKARVITSIAMFYDLEEPAKFVADVVDALAEDGIWISEFSYMPTMIENNSFDTVVHEHLEYYCLSVVERLFMEAGLEVVSAELNDVNGGSIRLFARHQGSSGAPLEAAEQLQRIRIREFELALDSQQPYEEFAGNVERVKQELAELLRSLKDEGKTIHVYGASTKGNTILQYVGIDARTVDCAADRNPDKWGSETIGTGIPIVSEEESRKRKPDYYLVLPWHFLEEFLDRERGFLEGGGKFILPLPEVKILDRSS